MMKRTDGGGGHGITVVNDDEKRDYGGSSPAMIPCGRRSERIFRRKFVRAARHVETQCGRDSHGNFTVYSTRDCSLQRRNQKLVEEAPAPFLSDAIIDTLGEYSRRLFETVDYVGLGTCEFMETESRARSTSLKSTHVCSVEHTVSEEVSGLDWYESSSPLQTAAS